MSEKIYRVNEVFLSLQGEAFWAGTPMIFIRFSGCNLHCPFCDTDFKSYTEMTIGQIQQEVLKYNCNKICLTGGEPMLQITPELREQFYTYGIHIETNGTIPVFFDSKYCWLTVSPKVGCIQQQGDELKVVWHGQTQEELEPFLKWDFNHFYLQPDSTYVTTPPLSALHEQRLTELINIIKRNPQWKLSLQLHKILKIR
jgi:organic radical activating enzyme